MQNNIIVFDTETTGFSPIKNEIIQFSYILYNVDTQTIIYATKPNEDIVKINGYVPKSTTDIHGLTKEMTLDKLPIKNHIDSFIYYFNQARQYVGHNIKFDINMIIGQLNKIINDYPEEKEKYNNFIQRFQIVGKTLPDAAYCTMEESTGICAEIKGNNKRKKEKLVEVHRLLFNQMVGGQLHNSLVDIAVTLRVFLKLTKGIDICENIFREKNISSLQNNNDICNLINPFRDENNVQNIDYTGELITGVTILPLQEKEIEKIMVKSDITQVAEAFVQEIQTTAMNNIMNQCPYQFTTNIMVCKTILKSGARKNKVCGLPTKYNNKYCGHHKPKVGIQNDMGIQPDINIGTNDFKNTNTIHNTSTNFVTNLFKPFTKKNKVYPVGGKRKTKNKKRIKRKFKNTKRKYKI